MAHRRRRVSSSLTSTVLRFAPPGHPDRKAVMRVVAELLDPEASLLRPGDVTDPLFEMPARPVPDTGFVVVYELKEGMVIVRALKPRE
jgi:hypothetical protein